MQNDALLLGMELGSTRIKATVMGSEATPLASGSYGWENKLVDGIWTYDADEIWKGVSGCIDDLLKDMTSNGGLSPDSIVAAGISGMMHGYVALDDNDELLVPFRTWRNNITGEASKTLTELFDYPIPQRWSIAHLFQAMLNGEEHLPRIRRLTTLAGYVQLKLTGEHVIGINDASGMFPIDVEAQDYDRRLMELFDREVEKRKLPWKIGELLPTIVPAGEQAGKLSKEGARILDPEGRIKAGLPLAPPEGDAGTGMIATNAVKPRGGNVSAGTSVFAMIVLEKSLSRAHEEIDLVVTPGGKAVAMVHSNNCTSDFDAWTRLLIEAARLLGAEVSDSDAIGTIMKQALEADPDAGGLLSFGYVSGEHVTGFSEGRPLFVRKPDAPFTLGNFVRAHLFGALGALRTGLNILTEEEGVEVDEIRGHGGFFKTPGVGQRLMAAMMRSPVSVMETAGEGGAWGMALLAKYMSRTDRSESLLGFLDTVFASAKSSLIEPSEEDIRGFQAFFERYTAGLPIERAAVERLI